MGATPIPDEEPTPRPPLVAGVPSAVSPLVRRVVAPNAGPSTGAGTNSYLVGIDEVVVVDPGPDVAAHIETIVRAAMAERLTAVVLTDVTPEHAGGAERLAAAVGVPICALERRGAATRVDRVLADGDTIDGTEFRLEVVRTPGLAANQACYLLEEERLVFTGDSVLEGTTPVIAPAAGGDLGAHLESLDRLQRLRPRRFAPGSGYVIEAPLDCLEEYRAHWADSERAIVTALGDGPARIHELVTRLYPGVESDLVDSAAALVHAHLLKLKAEGRVSGRAAREVWTAAA